MRKLNGEVFTHGEGSPTKASCSGICTILIYQKSLHSHTVLNL